MSRKAITLLVLSDPADRTLAMLESLPEDTTIAAGNSIEAFESVAPRADVILNWSGSRQLLEQVWKISPQVRWLHSKSAGLEHVLFPDLISSDVPLTNARGVFSRPLAEFVMAAILHFAKDLRRMVRSQVACFWDPFDVQEVHGKAIALVGYGDIGRTAARYAHGLGMRVTVLRRRPELAGADDIVEQVFPIERKRELLAGADYVVVATPLTPETRGLIGEEELRAMKETAVLINIGRGPVVDEAALVCALEENWIRGAALDVFDEEPLPAGHPLYALENVLLSPHCADHTPDWQERTMRLFLENFERFRNGEPLRNVVKKEQGY
jgi:phosphoglycerate dehydrogenase-like enzyme